MTTDPSDSQRRQHRVEVPAAVDRRPWLAPLREGHPTVGKICPGCGKPLKAGDVPALVTVGPGDDEDARRRAREGRAYNGVAVVAHDQCVNG